MEAAELQLAQAAQPAFRPDARVLAGRPTFHEERPDPRYVDDFWDLSRAVRKLSFKKRQAALFRWADWLGTEPQLCEALKEYAFVRLTELPPAGAHRRGELPAISTVHSEVRRLIHVAATTGTAFDALSQDDLDAFKQSNKARENTRWLAAHVSALQRYHAYSALLHTAPMSVNPWGGRSPSAVADDWRPLENTTERIPAPVIEGVLRWALFYVETASTDICAGLAEVRRQNDSIARGRPPEPPADRLRRFIDERRRAGRGMPATRGPRYVLGSDSGLTLNKAAVAQHLGLHRENLPSSLAPLVHRAVDELGLEEGTLDTAISAHPQTGRAWRPSFSRADLTREADMLVVACYVVIAYLSGMRDDEIQSLVPGCWFREPRRHGSDLWKVRSQVSKGRSGPVEETWVVLEETVRAVQVLERLQHLRGTSRLFASCHGNAKYEVVATTDMNARVNRFRDHMSILGSYSGLPAVSTHDGRPWHFTVRQFRRTLAWYIANRPMGVVAGTVQYKHVSVKTFLGYAGESRSGLRGEIKRELQVKQTADFLERVDRHRRGERAAGPGGRRLDQAMALMSSAMGALPGRVVDEARLRTMYEDIARHVHPGPHNDCYFDPDRALCRRHEKVEDRKAPLLNRCEPMRCGNTVFRWSHRSAWVEAIKDARRRLRGDLSPTQRLFLEEEIELMEQAVAKIDAEAHPCP